MSSFAAARVISTKKRFVVGGTNGRERDRSQVSDGKVKRAPRAWLLLGYMLCVESIRPLSGASCPLFYRPRGAGVTDGRKRKKSKIEKVIRGSWVFLFPCAYPANMADHVRDGVFIDPYRAVPWPLSASGVRPILRRRMVRRVRGPSYDPSGSRRGSDSTFITIGDVNSILDLVVVVCLC